MLFSPHLSLDDFRPIPFLRNPHLQTLLGHWLPGPRLARPTRAHVLRLPDGDALALHDTIPRGWRPGDRIALLLHGLSGNHLSPGILRLAAYLLEQGVRTVRLDLRGTGLALPLSRRTYTAGDSADLHAALLEAHSWSPRSPLLVVGISMGGNILVKLAGELGDDPMPQLRAMAALGPPIDLGRCAALLGQRRNRFYESYFIARLVAQARMRQRYFPDLPPLRLPRRMTMRLFDDLYTAPRRGYADAFDYYRRASSAPLLGRIRVPTLILTARDDPFIAIEPFEELKPPPALTLTIVQHGGHLGFLGRDGSGGFRWAERYLVRWLLETSA